MEYQFNKYNEKHYIPKSVLETTLVNIHHRDSENITSLKNMKIVRFSDTLEIFYVPERDECRYPDRDLLEKKRRFENTVKDMDHLLRNIHVLKMKFVDGKKSIEDGEYFEQLKSIFNLKKLLQENTEYAEIYSSSEDDSSYEFSDDNDDINDNDDLEIIFE